jgi:hypothetical protein
MVRFDYSAPRSDYAETLVFDRSGLVLSYPGIASRAARNYQGARAMPPHSDGSTSRTV